MIIVGVDPGAKGAVCILNAYNFKDVKCIPLAHNTLADIFTFLSEIRGGEPCSRARANHVLPKGSSSRVRMVKVEPNNPTNRRIINNEDTDNSDISIEQILQSKDIPYDNTMEMWLEEPGQIVVNSKTTREDGKRDNTGALLAGMKASRSLGRSVGQWEGIAAGLNISVNLVPPKVWQGRLKCLTRGDKNISKKCAYTVFPYLTDKSGRTTITHDIADSLLIATYGYLQYADPKYYTSGLRKQLSGVPQ